MLSINFQFFSFDICLYISILLQKLDKFFNMQSLLLPTVWLFEQILSENTIEFSNLFLDIYKFGKLCFSRKCYLAHIWKCWINIKVVSLKKKNCKQKQTPKSQTKLPTSISSFGFYNIFNSNGHCVY